MWSFKRREQHDMDDGAIGHAIGPSMGYGIGHGIG